MEGVLHAAAEAVDAVGVVDGEEGQGLAAGDIDRCGVGGEAQFEFQQFHAVGQRGLAGLGVVDDILDGVGEGGWGEHDRGIDIEPGHVDDAFEFALLKPEGVLHGDDGFETVGDTGLGAG